jgi:hypothetical protein
VHGEATAADILKATALAHEVLGRSLDDLPPQTRRLLHLIRQMVKERCASRRCKQSDIHFSRKELREYTGTGDTVRAEGWKRVEAEPDTSYEARSQFRRRHPEPLPLSEEAAAEHRIARFVP